MLWIAVLAFGTLFLSHTAPFPFLLDKFAPSRSIWRMPHAGGPPTVYLTFDDGPNPTATPQLLDVLRETGATATFFLIDAHLTSETAPIVRRMFEEGHAVALHSDTRALMVKSPDALSAILLRQAGRIEQLAGSRPPVPAARRLAQRHDVPRPRTDRSQAGGVDVRDVGLQLVSPSRRTHPIGAAGPSRLPRRHHRHARRASRGPAAGPAVRRGGDAAAGDDLEAEGLGVRTALRSARGQVLI